ncbi:MAG: universal stress protein [Desulfomonile tiedjei]|uniref:Universal stress protein n=1 Tax=Desulfomonile tiedjei TaxID=2358 RepID=A0A9D6V4B3_9BACT|nr:universal stress protein [Desulfomonile tiedjei]
MKVLVGVDKSPESHTALAYVCHLLEHFDADVHAIYVKPDEVQIAPESFYAPFFSKEGLERWLDSEALQVRTGAASKCEYCLAGKVPCEPLIAEGDPAETILEQAEDGKYDMIVLGSHGLSYLRGFLLGTVHAKILHNANKPVLIVRDFREIKKVLVAYRGSSCDQQALEFIARLLARKRPEITILHVQEARDGENKKSAEACLITGHETLRTFGHEPVIKTLRGDFVDEILKEVRGSLYDLIVLGAYGHRKPRFLQLISDEALNLVRSTTLPVLVFRDNSSERTKR